MSLAYPKMRLVIPSLHQGNEKAPDWCGRTSASMIFNYYYAAERGGRGGWWNELIINQRDKDPRDLVFRGPINPGFPVIGGAPIAAYGYDLRGTLNLAKKQGWREKEQLFPQQGRALPSEAEVLARFAPVTRALDLNNPVLFYSGLSMGVRHIVVISGYWLRGNELWIHIDDPGHQGPATSNGDLPEIRFSKIFAQLPHGVIGDPARQIEQLRPDAAVDGAPGIRYWLHARLLFMKNPNTPVEEDVFGDHGWFGVGNDSPGMTVVCNHEFTDPGGLLDAEVPARYPVILRDPLGSSEADRAAPLIELWNGVTSTAAPYPLGTNRSWHNGIHIPETNSGVTSRDVLSVGAGEVVAARFPRSGRSQASRGIVIVRHAYDPKALRLYHPPSEKLPDGHRIVFSLYGNLLGGAKGTKPLLDPLDPGPKVSPARFVPYGAALTILARVASEGGTTLQPLASERPALGARIDTKEADEKKQEKAKNKKADEAERDYGVLEDEFIAASAPSQFGASDASAWHLLPMAKSLRNLDAWETKPEKPGLFDFKKKKEAKDDPMVDVLERVEQGESVLLGVNLDGDGWELVDGVVRVRDDYAEDVLELHRTIEAAGKKRYFKDPAPRFEAVEKIAVVKGLALPCVEEFVGYGNTRRALVEVSYGVRADEIRDNQSEVDLWHKLDELRSALKRRLISDALVDLRALDAELGITPEAIEKDARLGWRLVTKRPIATMGRLTAKSDLEVSEGEQPSEPSSEDEEVEPDENRGLHVEIFAGAEILGYEHNTRGWVQVSEQGDDAPGMEAFFRAQLRALFSINELRSPAIATLGYRDGDDQWAPPNRDEWVRFTSRHPRTLSRFIVTHRSEWTLDWDAICGTSNTSDRLDVRTCNIPEGDRKPVLPGTLHVDGLEADTFVYYHPLRLVEFLTTGVDLTLTDLAGDDVDPPWITFDDDDSDTISLSGSADETQGQFRARLILGDPTALGTSLDPGSDDGAGMRSDVLGLRPATLVLRGLETTQENIPILLRRGEVQQLSFVRPHVNFQLTRGGWATSMRAIPVSTKAVDERHARQEGTELEKHMYMAADENAKLPEEPVSRAFVVAAARYNLDGPTKAIVELEGEGFSIGQITISGATGVGHEIPGQAKYEIDLFTIRRELPRSAGEVAIVIPVLPKADCDVKATLTVSVEGGDLVSRQEATFTFQTRTMRYGDPPGDDVAKVQLYLSQMLGQGKDANAPKVPHHRAARGNASIDGGYGDDLARALWRFILTERFRAWPLPEIQTSAGTVPVDTLSRDFQQHEQEVERLVKEKHFPIVDRPLLAEIVKRYVFPNVLPTLQIGPVTHPAAGGGAWQDVLGKWADWSDVERSTILPHVPAAADPDAPPTPTPPMELEIRCVLTYDPGGDKRGMPAEVTITDGDVYRLEEHIVSLVKLLATPIRLAPSGVMDAGAKPELRIAGDNGQVWTKALGGTPDFREKGTDGFAAAVMQKLMKSTKIKDKPAYAEAIDGDWDKACAAAMKAIRKDVDRKIWDDYKDLVAHLHGEVIVKDKK